METISNYSLPSSPLTSSYLSTRTKNSSIIEKLEDGSYKDTILTSNDGLTNSSPILKTPLFWNPELLSINSSRINSAFKEYRLTGDATIIQKLEKKSFENKDKVEKLLKSAIKDYNKYCSKKQDDSKLNGEYIYMKLQIKEIEIIKYELIIKIFNYYHSELLKKYEQFKDPYNTNGEIKKYQEELNESFNAFYDILIKIEFLEREENKMIYLLQNKKYLKISSDGYMRYYWDRLTNRI